MKPARRKIVFIVLALIFAVLAVLVILYFTILKNYFDKNSDKQKKLPSDTSSTYTQVYTKFYNFEDTWDTKISQVVSRSGHNSLMLYPGGEYCPGLVINYSDIHDVITPIEITASVYVYTESDLVKNPVTLVIQVTDNDKKIDYLVLNSDTMTSTRKGWNELYSRQVIRNITSLNNVVSVYVYYRGTEKVYVDDLLITIFKVTKN